MSKKISRKTTKPRRTERTAGGYLIGMEKGICVVIILLTSPRTTSMVNLAHLLVRSDVYVCVHRSIYLYCRRTEWSMPVFIRRVMGAVVVVVAVLLVS